MKRVSEKLLTVFECEQLTGRKVSSWRKDIAQRRIPIVRIGRSVRIPYEVIQQLIHEGWRDPISLQDSK